jgi:single-strand DNA-binding protein
MNHITIIGRLTATPELKATANGTNVCSFTVAVERKFKDSDGNSVTDFIDCVAWKHTAEFLCKWFDKGVRLAISGELQTRFYTDKTTDKKVKVCEVLVSDVEFADGKTQAKPTESANTTTKASSKDDFIPISADDDGLPWNS